MLTKEDIRGMHRKKEERHKKDTGTPKSQRRLPLTAMVDNGLCTVKPYIQSHPQLVPLAPPSTHKTLHPENAVHCLSFLFLRRVASIHNTIMYAIVCVLAFNHRHPPPHQPIDRTPPLLVRLDEREELVLAGAQHLADLLLAFVLRVCLGGVE